MMKRIWERYKDIITYLFYGVCTTFINIVVYWILSYFFDVMVSTIGAWIVAVVFAYITNRRNVFKSKANILVIILNYVASKYVIFKYKD